MKEWMGIPVVSIGIIYCIPPRKGKQHDSSKPCSTTFLLDIFDRIYCITLESRPDRQFEARRQFAAVGLADLVEFIVVRKNMADQAQGIFQSHMLCLQKGLATGARHILVFEDDVFFRGFNRQRLEEACRFLHDNARWRPSSSAASPAAPPPTATRAVRRIRYRCLAHAYAVNRPFAEGLIREEWPRHPL